MWLSYYLLEPTGERGTGLGVEGDAVEADKEDPEDGGEVGPGAERGRVSHDEGEGTTQCQAGSRGAESLPAVVIGRAGEEGGGDDEVADEVPFPEGRGGG
jgi:hypothetical protein